MITFTETGAQKVQEFLASQSTDVQTSGLRVGVRGGGCSGLQYALAFDQERPGDEVMRLPASRLGQGGPGAVVVAKASPARGLEVVRVQVLIVAS